MNEAAPDWCGLIDLTRENDLDVVVSVCVFVQVSVSVVVSRVVSRVVAELVVGRLFHAAVVGVTRSDGQGEQPSENCG